MVMLYAGIIVGIGLLIILQTYWIWSYNQARKKGMVPEKGKATMFDVRRLLLEGEKELAIRLYCEIFRVNPRTAKKDIDELERSLKA